MKVSEVQIFPSPKTVSGNGEEYELKTSVISNHPPFDEKAELLSLCFKKAFILPVILTVPFCILGMIGDLFASAIKRSVNLKDYGSLIPGHGGILDRMDSIIMIVPLLYLLQIYGVI